MLYELAYRNGISYERLISFLRWGTCLLPLGNSLLPLGETLKNGLFRAYLFTEESRTSKLIAVRYKDSQLYVEPEEEIRSYAQIKTLQPTCPSHNGAIVL